MKIKCDHCGKEFSKKPSAVKTENYCSKECRTQVTTITKPCEICGVSVTRCRSQIRTHVFCGSECSRIFTSRCMTSMNIELNPDRMTPKTRAKVRKARLGTGKGKSYPKYYGKHEHRIVAEKMLGRPLSPEEVVHHIGGDITNNSPLNLMIMPNQKAHAKWHWNEKNNPQANYE